MGPAPTRSTSSSALTAWLWLLAVGAVTLLGQVVLLRELSVAFHGSELVTLLALAGWLLGSGLGAGLGRRGGGAAPLLLRSMLLAYAALLPGCAMAARALKQTLGAIPGGELPLLGQLLGASLVLLPCALLAGALFRVTARTWLGPRRSLVQAYGLESAGALLGGALSSGLVLVGMGNLALALLTALLALGAAVLPGPGARRWLHGLCLAGAVLGVLLLAGSGPLDRALTSLDHPSLLDSRDTPYGRVTVEQRSEQAVVYLNGALVHETQGVDPDAFVHPAALQVEDHVVRQYKCGYQQQGAHGKINSDQLGRNGTHHNAGRHPPAEPDEPKSSFFQLTQDNPLLFMDFLRQVPGLHVSCCLSHVWPPRFATLVNLQLRCRLSCQGASCCPRVSQTATWPAIPPPGYAGTCRVPRPGPFPENWSEV